MNNFKKLTDIEHVLQCPQMYIGSIDFINCETFIYENDKFKIKQFSYIPALIKIVDEILDNSIDSAIRSNFKCNKINVEIYNDHVRITDNGDGIPTVQYSKDDKRYLPELAWTQMRAGTSFDENRQTIGAHGLGSVATNIFSKEFIGETCDGNKKCIVKCENNLSKINTTIRSSKNKGVSVFFIPDWDKFKIKGFDQIHKDIIYQRILNLSICFPQINFYFNNQKIRLNSKGFIRMFDENAIAFENEKIILGIAPNDYGDFKFYSFVNGIKLLNGGNHIDIITNEIVSGIRKKISKKYKNIMPGDIKNKISLIIFLKNFTNPKFDSQTKERLTNSNKEINDYIDNSIDYENIIKQCLKNKNIIDPIIETFNIKEELKLKKDLKNKVCKKFKSEKYYPPIGNNEMLMLTEGNSACGGLAAALGRNNIGYYALKGVVLNAYDSSLQKIASNQELKEISQILNIQLGMQNDDMNFKKIVVATDFDSDGHHIAMLLFGVFYKFFKKMFNDYRIFRLRTPLICLFDNKNKITKFFFDISEFKEWENDNKNHKYRIKYFKGLGSWKKEELQFLIQTKGLEYFLQPYIIENNDEQYLDWWLKTENTDKRKEFIKQYSLNIDLI